MKSRVFYFDRLRIISTFAVILIHISGAELFNHAVGSQEWNVYNIFDSFSRFAVPVFVMLSGALFLDPERSVEIKSLYKKNMLRIAAAFVVWSLFYALLSFDGDIKEFVKSVVIGHYHMWFLYMLAGLYIATPMLRQITENSSTTRYFLIFSFLFTFLLPLISELPRMSAIETVLKKIDFRLAVGYTAYFVGGYYLAKQEIYKKARAAIYLLGAIGFFATVLLTYRLSVSSQSVCDDFYSYFSITVLLQSIAVFVFAKYNLSQSPKTNRASRVISEFSKITFGVYLVHVFVLEQIKYFGFLNGIDNAVIYTIVNAAITFTVSALISFLLNKIPVIKKYIV